MEPTSITWAESKRTPHPHPMCCGRALTAGEGGAEPGRGGQTPCKSLVGARRAACGKRRVLHPHYCSLATGEQQPVCQGSHDRASTPEPGFWIRKSPSGVSASGSHGPTVRPSPPLSGVPTHSVFPITSASISSQEIGSGKSQRETVQGQERHSNPGARRCRRKRTREEGEGAEEERHFSSSPRTTSQDKEPKLLESCDF